MSDYINKRIEYINNWPNVTPFEAEKNFEKRCNDFESKNGRYPLSLMSLWMDTDDSYNRTISHFIDSIDVMPYHPNFAFTFMFSALDYYAKNVYSNTNTTICLKNLAEEVSVLANQNNDINILPTTLFSSIPVSATMYLYKCLCNLKQNNKAYSRLTTNVDNTDNVYRKNIVDSIEAKYGKDSQNRSPALLYRTIFRDDSVFLGGTIVNITNNFRIHLLLSGIIYSLRNDSFHGSSMSSTKSSQTTPKRYAMNYYCYIATYTLMMILLVKSSTMSDADKNNKYTELKDITLRNINDFTISYCGSEKCRFYAVFWVYFFDLHHFYTT